MPRAPPNSRLVSEIAEAVPAFSGGAVVSTREVAIVEVIPTPAVSRAYPAISTPMWEFGSIVLTQKNPDAQVTRPAAIRNAGRMNRPKIEAATTPARLPPTVGNIHSAASKGPYPSTIWMKVTAIKPMPADPKTTVELAMIEALNEARLKSPTSIIGVEALR